MAQCGIPIPAEEGSRVAVVQKIFADIGDEQSLKDNLSTFSAWIRTTARIVQEADAASLVLLDEVGGDRPAEGPPGHGLIDRLRARGAKTAVTTHLHLLKAYGSLHPDVVNVSVEVDPETLRPTYRLIYGRPGESYALLMAEKYGMPSELLEQAKSYLGEGDRKVGDLLAVLERNQQEWENKIREAEGLKREAGTDREQARALLLRAKAEEKERLEKARDESREVIQEAREELRRLIREFKAQGRSDVHSLDRAIREKESNLRQSFSKEEEGSETEKPARILHFGLESTDPSLLGGGTTVSGKKTGPTGEKKNFFPVRCSMKSRRPPANSKSSGFGSKKRFPWWTKPSMKLSWEGCGNCKSFTGPGPAGFARPCGIICGNMISWRILDRAAPTGGATASRSWRSDQRRARGAPRCPGRWPNEGRDSRGKNRRD
jgi:hypothetical protein